MKCYRVALTNKKRNRTSSFLADSFSVSDDRMVIIKSKKFGNVSVLITDEEELAVSEIELEDDMDLELFMLY